MATSVIINGVTYSDVPRVDIPASGGGTATFYNCAGDTATATQILAGKIAHSSGGQVTGTMVNRGGYNASISTVAGTVSIPEGYHSGGGAVSILSSEQEKIVEENIKSGITILGVSGKASVVDTSDATATASQILSGYSGYVNGSLVTGTMTAATVSQDGSTKVLSIS